MSIKAINWAFSQSMSPTQKIVLLALSNRADDADLAWPSMSTICRDTCLSERAVRNALRALQEAGSIAPSGRVYKSHCYKLAVTGGHEGAKNTLDQPVQTGTSFQETGISRPQTGTTCRNNNEETGTSFHQTGISCRQTGTSFQETGTTCPQSIKNHQEPSVSRRDDPEEELTIDTAWRPLVRQVQDAAGYDLARLMPSAADGGEVRQWLADITAKGHSVQAASEIVLMAIDTVMERRRDQGPPKTLRYFRNAVAEMAVATPTRAAARMEAAYLEYTKVEMRHKRRPKSWTVFQQEWSSAA